MRKPSVTLTATASGFAGADMTGGYRSRDASHEVGSIPGTVQLQK
jgi:hypothetical protein